MSNNREATMSSALRVTVTQVLYLVTEAVLHQVFEVYGHRVVELHVFQGATWVEAIVQLRLHHEAVRARDALNGRAIYDGCYFLDIDYAPPACTTAAAPEVHNKAASHDVVHAHDSMLEGTSVVDASSSTTSALTTKKEEKTIMEILAEIKATLDHMLAKVDASPSPSTPTVAFPTVNPAAPHTGVCEDGVDAMHAMKDITVVPSSTAPTSQVHATPPVADVGKELQVGTAILFDTGRTLQTRFPIWLAIPHARAEVRVLSGGLENHDLLNLDTMCNIIPADNNQ